MAHLYEIFSGEELKIAEKIQQRRYQLLVHSYIYYELNSNIVPDSKWSKWAVELAELQYEYPDIAKQVVYAKDFEDWDGSTGAFLTFKDKSNIITTANRLLSKPDKFMPALQKPAPLKKTKHTGRKLF
jgi:retron-type reverse transcriptase